MSKFKLLHKIQAATLIVAIALLWFPYGNHHVNMGFSTAIIAINAIIEFMG